MISYFSKEEEEILGRCIVLQTNIRQESLIRGDEFPYVLCGVEILPITLRKLNHLKYCGNSYVLGGSPDEEDATQLIYILRKNKKLTIEKIVKQVIKKDVVEEVFDFVESMFIDAQLSKGAGEVSTSLFQFEAVDLLAREYNWDEDKILDLPLPRLFQYLNLIIFRDREDRPIDLYQRRKLELLTAKGGK